MVKVKSKKQKVKLQIKIQNFRKEWGGTIGWGLGILGLFFFIRLANLTLLPIFVDEAIYIRWSQVMRVESTLRFLPLSDGKQPLFMWLTIPFLKIFSDPLFAGRFLSVLSGLGSLAGLFLISYQLFKDKKIALVASLLYAVIPFLVFFDRMALVDSMLAMFGIWTAYLGILLVRWLRLDLAMITGMILGVALITKSPAIFFALLLPAAILIADWFNLREWRKIIPRVLKLIGLWGVVYLFAFFIYNLLRLGPNFNMIGIRNKDYIFSVREIFSHPLDPLRPHLTDLAVWLPNLLTWPILLSAIVGWIWLWWRQEKRREAIFLCLMITVPLLIQSIFARVFTPRYILFTIWPLLIFAAYCLVSALRLLATTGLSTACLSVRPCLPAGRRGKVTVDRQWLVVGLLGVILLPAVWYNFHLLYKLERAPLPRKMRSGYLEEWTAGQGIKETAEFIKGRTSRGSVLVGTEGAFGTLPDGLQVYLEGMANVIVIGVGYPITGVHESLINSLADNDVYLVVNQSRLQIPFEAYGLKLVEEFPKAINPKGEQDKLLLFAVDKEFWLR